MKSSRREGPTCSPGSGRDRDRDRGKKERCRDTGRGRGSPRRLRRAGRVGAGRWRWRGSRVRGEGPTGSAEDRVYGHLVPGPAGSGRLWNVRWTQCRSPGHWPVSLKHSALPRVKQTMKQKSSLQTCLPWRCRERKSLSPSPGPQAWRSWRPHTIHRAQPGSDSLTPSPGGRKPGKQ